MQVKEEMLKPVMAADGVYFGFINAISSGTIRQGFGCINTVSFVNNIGCWVYAVHS